MRHSLQPAFIISIALTTSLLFGCASPKVAQKKTVEVAGQRLEFGGTFEPRGSELSLGINGDPVMNGRFPPFTPTLRMNAEYRGLAVRAECYFGSVLSRKAGAIGIVAGAVQSAHNRAGDKCDLQVNGQVVESLYF